MAGPYVILNDDYVVDDYAQASYVGTADDLYVVEDYIADAITGSASLNSAYSVLSSIGIIKQLTAQSDSASTLTVQGGTIKQISATLDSALNAQIQANATVSPGADITSNFTLSASGEIFRELSAELITAGDEVTWDTALTWYEARSEIWGPLFYVNGTLTFNVTDINLNSNFSTSIDGDVTAIGTLVVDSFGNLTASANADFTASATLQTETALNADANVATDVINFVMSTSATLSSNGIAVVLSQPVALDTEFTTSIDGNYVADGITDIETNAQVALTGNEFRIRFGSTDLETESTLSVNAVRTRDTIANLVTQGLVEVSANPRYGAFQDVLETNTTLRCNGGRLRLLSATLDAFAATVSTLTIYNIDPYRVYTVPSELRTTQIVPDSRVFMLLDENRINTIERETRHFNIGSETRQLTVQHNPLVELETTLDRRQG